MRNLDLIKVRNLDLITVCAVAKELMNAKKGKEYKYDTFPVKLIKDGRPVIRYACVVFEEAKRDALSKTMIEVSEKKPLVNEGDFKIDPSDGCLIALLDDDKLIGKMVSFDDKCAGAGTAISLISSEYKYIQDFFNEYFSHVESSIRNNERIKDDDIYQLLSLYKRRYFREERQNDGLGQQLIKKFRQTCRTVGSLLHK